MTERSRYSRISHGPESPTLSPFVDELPTPARSTMTPLLYRVELHGVRPQGDTLR